MYDQAYIRFLDACALGDVDDIKKYMPKKKLTRLTLSGGLGFAIADKRVAAIDFLMLYAKEKKLLDNGILSDAVLSACIFNNSEMIEYLLTHDVAKDMIHLDSNHCFSMVQEKETLGVLILRSNIQQTIEMPTILRSELLEAAYYFFDKRHLNAKLQSELPDDSHQIKKHKI